MDLVGIIFGLFVWFLFLACPILLFFAIYLILRYRFKVENRIWNAIITLIIFSVIFLAFLWMFTPLDNPPIWIIVVCVFVYPIFPSLLFLAIYLILILNYTPRIRSSIWRGIIAFVISSAVTLPLVGIISTLYRDIAGGILIISYLFSLFAFPCLLFLAIYPILCYILKVRNRILNAVVTLVISFAIFLSMLWILGSMAAVHLLFFPWTDCQAYLLCRLVQGGEHLAIVIAALVMIIPQVIERVRKITKKS